MIINHNLNSMNAHRNMSFNTTQTGKAMEKLSSGLRINRAGDDAAGLAISEKMRGQIRGLEQATRNSQDGISMIQTAEGALNETHSILQRMRELAVQASNDTNVGVDRAEIQKEINQLSSEINRVGNTTEFNTQSLLKGNGEPDLPKTGLVAKTTESGSVTKTQATATVEFSTAVSVGNPVNLSIAGKEFDYAFTAAHTNDAPGYAAAATELETALNNFINSDESLKGQFSVSKSAGVVTIEAVADGDFDGAAGTISQATGAAVGSSTAGVGTTVEEAATSTIDFSSLVKTATGVSAAATTTALEELVGKGFEINGQKVEFYNVNNGAYKGEAAGVDISKALEAAALATNNAPTAAAERTAIEDALVNSIVNQIGTKLDGVTLTNGTNGDLVVTTNAKGENAKLELADGSVKKEFSASFQVGANKGQSMTIEIADMRSEALGITGKAGDAGFTSKSVVTDGTDNQVKEAALDVSNAKAASSAVEVINKAIETVSAQRSNLGSFQNRLEHTINNLGTSAENLTAAESRIRDVDMAKEMMNFTKNNILNQAAQAMMSQANQQPQAVLQLLR